MHRRFCLFSMKDFAALSRCSIENPFAGQVEVPLEVEEAPQRYSLERAGWFHWISMFQQHERVKTKSNVPHFVFEEAHPKITKEASQDETTFQVSTTSPGLCCPPKSLWTKKHPGILLSQQFSSKAFPWLLVLGGFEERPIGSAAGRLVRSSLKWLAAKQPDCGVPICFKKNVFAPLH